jgi:hypothetical protein
MPDERDLHERVNARDSGLRRLRTLTGVLAVAMTALAGVFAGLAAQTTAGRKLIGATVHAGAAGTTARQRQAQHRRTAIPPPPPLPAAGSDSAPAPAAPAQPPATAPAPAPPVVVSGGS